jgi:hypothetical protein
VHPEDFPLVGRLGFGHWIVAIIESIALSPAMRWKAGPKKEMSFRSVLTIENPAKQTQCDRSIGFDALFNKIVQAIRESICTFTICSSIQGSTPTA